VSHQRPQLPRSAMWILRVIARRDDYGCVSGDFEEIYWSIVRHKSVWLARLWLVIELLNSIPRLAKTSLYWSVVMFANYMKTAFRNMRRHKGFAFINISGLALGFACSMLIALFVTYELSYDRFNEKADRIYRVVRPGDRSTPPALAQALQRDIPEVEAATDFADLKVQPVRFQDHVSLESPIRSATHECFEIFSFPLLSGDSTNVLKEPNTVVLTRSMAERVFGDTDPLNKVIAIGDSDYRVDGVMEDVPDNSHFHFACLVSNNTFDWYHQEIWGSNWMATYVLLRDPKDAPVVESKLRDIVTKYFGPQDGDNEVKFLIQPLTSIHLKSDLRFELEPNGDFGNIIIFTTVALLIITIAGLNFANLTTAKSMVRIKEIGIRRTLGSTRKNLIQQFLGESVIMSLLSLAAGLILAYAALPVFHLLVGREIGLEAVDLWVAVPSFVLLAILVALLAGAYPALYLSSFQPVQVIKDILGSRKTSSRFRTAMVVFQFVVSIMLMVGTLTVHRQLDFLQNGDLGFEKEQVLVLQNLKPEPLKSERLKNELLRNENIVAVSSSGNLPGEEPGRQWLQTAGGERLLVGAYYCDYDHMQALQLKMARGRFFSSDYGTDTAGIILNEQAIKELSLEDPIGKKVAYFSDRPEIRTIVGVVQDFHFLSLHQQMQALVMLPGINKGWGINHVSVRLNTRDLAGTIKYIKEVWESINPEMPFAHTFLDEDYNALYANEQATGKTALVFCTLAIVVCCLGLYGLSTYVIERRIKEISIRKIVGASVKDIVWLLSRRFLQWVALAFVLAVPLGWYFTQRWLDTFAYRVDLTWGVFLVAGATALVIACLTISLQLFKAALAKPAETLRYE
jgi:putative ABC transport system permease protein